MSEKKIVFAVGGTGGHLFPAIALAEQLIALDPTLTILFAGGGIKNPEWLHAPPFSYTTIPSAPLSFKNPMKLLSNLFAIRKGISVSKKLLSSFDPTLVIGFGSFYSLPLLAAAKSLAIPYILHEQNAIPGRVIRLFSKRAAFTAIHFEGAIPYLKGNSLLVEMPLRWKYSKEVSVKEKAKKYFSLEGQGPVVLIFGGSQGASRINQWVTECIEMLRKIPLQILHFTGSPEEAVRMRERYKKVGIVASVKDFEERMDLAWQLADITIARAGAMSLAEQVEFEVPGILIPYPQAMDNHQEINADFFVSVVQGGIKYLEGSGSGDGLAALLLNTIESGALKRFQKNLSHYKKTKSSKQMVEAVWETICHSSLLVAK